MRGSCFLLIVLFGLSGTCHAQWKKLFQFSDAARSIYFLDKLGHPEIGFVGLNNGELWQTTDTGKTWQKVQTDPDGLSIPDIAFKDAMTGWFVTEPFFGQKGPSKVFTTSDGGASWNVQMQDPGGSFTSIYYHQPTKMLFLSNWQRGGSSSSDDGNTWNLFTDKPNLNGYAFSDQADGIISFAGVSSSLNMQTVDGGVNWQALFISSTACWQPAAIAGTTTFFMFSEYTATLSRSDDTGLTWVPIKSLLLSPGGLAGFFLSGCLRNTPCNQMFIQTTAEGFYSSSDLGLTWTAIGGPPNESDTRFWIDQNDLFGTDYQGALWVLHTVPTITAVIPQLHTVRTGKNPILSFSLSNDVPASDGFDSLSFELQFDADMLHLDSAVAPAGWKVDTNEIQPGRFHFVFHDLSHSDITANQSLVLFYFSSYVSKDSLSTVFLNGENAFFDQRKHFGCAQSVLSLDPANDTLTIAAADSCGDRSLRHFLATGNIETRIISIHPNPASNEIAVETETPSQCEVTVAIYDELGKEYMDRKQVLAGRMTLTFPVASFPAGIYHLMVKSPDGSVSSEFVKIQ